MKKFIVLLILGIGFLEIKMMPQFYQGITETRSTYVEETHTGINQK